MIRQDQSVTIRLYRPADHTQIEWLYQRTPPAGQVAWHPMRLPDDLKRIPQHFVAFWVAVQRVRDEVEAVVGITGVARVGAVATGAPVPDFLETTRPTARLHHVAVAPERWRHGIGAKLVRTAIDWARDEGFEKLILETTPQQEAALQLYRAIGFVETGRSMLGTWELVWFEMDL